MGENGERHGLFLASVRQLYILRSSVSGSLQRTWASAEGFCSGDRSLGDAALGDAALGDLAAQFSHALVFGLWVGVITEPQWFPSGLSPAWDGRKPASRGLDRQLGSLCRATASN